MGQPYIGEIRMFGGNFAIAGWAFCNGQLLPISEYDALFALIGTTYGGDGQTTFALPNLQSRVPIHMGTGPGLSSRQIGETGGTETVTVTVAQMAGHTHTALADPAEGTSTTAAGKVWAKSSATLPYAAPTVNATMNAGTLGSTGGGQAHTNIGPFSAVNFIISLFGVFPTPN